MSRVGAALGRLSRFHLRGKRRRAGSASNKDAPETRQMVSDRLAEELSQMLREGEIGPALARRIAGELFEPSLPGEAPLLGDKAWRDYQAGRAADRSPASGRSRMRWSEGSLNANGARCSKIGASSRQLRLLRPAEQFIELGARLGGQRQDGLAAILAGLGTLDQALLDEEADPPLRRRQLDRCELRQPGHVRDRFMTFGDVERQQQCERDFCREAFFENLHSALAEGEFNVRALPDLLRVGPALLFFGVIGTGRRQHRQQPACSSNIFLGDEEPTNIGGPRQRWAPCSLLAP